MTTPFSLLLQATGLSIREAAGFLGVRPDTATSWSSGRNPAKDSVLNELRALHQKQRRTAAAALSIARREKPDMIALAEPLTLDDLSRLGWPCVGAWRGMAASARTAIPLRISATQ